MRRRKDDVAAATYAVFQKMKVIGLAGEMVEDMGKLGVMW